MQERRIGTVGALFRYPVKSMLGEYPYEVTIGPGGIVGDRGWALRELAGGRIVSAKKWGNLFEFRASYETEPESGASASVCITLPDGRTTRSGDTAASAMISAALGHQVQLEQAVADRTFRGLYDLANVFGDIPPEQVLPQIMPYLSGEASPEDFAMPKGTFFDAAPIHLLASGTLEHLQRLEGGGARFDARRFRPNILIDTGVQADSFVEDRWIGAALRLGAMALVTVTGPVPRCVMTTHSQAELPRDLSILRTLVSRHGALAGVYGAIRIGGRVRLGDPVTLVSTEA